MTEWTPERVATVREEMDAPSPLLTWPEHRLISTNVCADLITLARIGLAVVEGDDATVERVKRAAVRAAYEEMFPEDGVISESRVDRLMQANRATGAWNDAIVAARAALQALADGGRE